MGAAAGGAGPRPFGSNIRWYNTGSCAAGSPPDSLTMTGCLHVVSTPIGNLEDITLRALRVLREVDLIAAEDTRRTARLLQHYSISTRTTSLHEHNERRKIPALIARLRAGARIALVSDAGTPGVSDPGTRLVRAVHEQGIRVEAVPGPSAVLAALVSSGFTASPFVFAGFPPTRSKDRSRWFEELGSDRRTLVFFEAPHRILRTLREAGDVLGKRHITVCRELTKVFEELVVSPTNEVLGKLGKPRGEYTLVVEPLEDAPFQVKSMASDAILAEEFAHLTKNDALDRRAAVRSLADRHGMRSRDVYQALERAKCSGK